MKRVLPFIVAFIPVIFLLLAPAANAQGLTALSVWQNQRGSTFAIDTYDPNTGAITGTYINRAAGYSCIGTPYPATGWILGSAISWTVIWNNAYENCNSVTSWAGFYANNAITTQWVLSTQSANYAGSDTFTAVTKNNAAALK